MITNNGIIFLIVGSGNFGPAVSGPAGPVPMPLWQSGILVGKFLLCHIVGMAAVSKRTCRYEVYFKIISFIWKG